MYAIGGLQALSLILGRIAYRRMHRPLCARAVQRKDSIRLPLFDELRITQAYPFLSLS